MPDLKAHRVRRVIQKESVLLFCTSVSGNGLRLPPTLAAFQEGLTRGDIGPGGNQFIVPFADPA
jgi:hypothetical protein